MATGVRIRGREEGGEETHRQQRNAGSNLDDDHTVDKECITSGSALNSRYESVTQLDEDAEKILTTPDAASVDVALQRVGFGRYQYIMCVALGWALAGDAVEVLAVSFLLPFAMCDLHASSLEKGALSAVGFAGMLLGSVIWGSVADVIGRQKALLFCQSMNAVFAIASSFASNLPNLLIARLLSGIGVGGTLPLLLVYFIEFLPQQKRGRWMGLQVCFWTVGQFLVAGLAWIVLPKTDWDVSIGSFKLNSWRIFLLLASIPCSTSAMLFLVFPETPFYLLQKGRDEEARALLRRIFAVNNWGSKSAVNFPSFVSVPAANMATTNYTAGHSHCSRLFKGIKGMASRVATLCTYRRHRTPFLLSSTVYFCIGFSSYGLGMWFPELFKRLKQSDGASVCSIAANRSSSDDECSTESLLRNGNAVFADTFMQAAAAVPGNVIFLCVVDVVGPKVLLGGSLVLSSSLVLLMWFASSHALGVGAAMGFTAINIFSWNGMMLIAPELFATDIRSTAQGLQMSMVRLASVAANLVVGATIDTACSAMMLLMGAVLVVGAYTSVLLPATFARGRLSV